MNKEDANLLHNVFSPQLKDMEDRFKADKKEGQFSEKKRGGNKGTLLELDTLVNKIDDAAKTMFLLFILYA